jgi:hypothetical protein
VAALTFAAAACRYCGVPTTIATGKCPDCSSAVGADDLVCPLCGQLLRRAAAPSRSDLPQPSPHAVVEVAADTEPERILGLPAGVACVAIGAVLAPVFGLTPLLSYMAWILDSLIHEMGHCLFGLLLGTPMIPAIRLDGHAVSFHGADPPGIWAWITGLAYPIAGWQLRQHRGALIAFAAMTVAYPLCVFTAGKELFIILGGHLGEAMFATLALHRAITGGSTAHKAERIAYAVVGCELMRRNIALCFGLVTSAAARDHYAGNGSFGLTNDLIRAAEDVLHCSLPTVGMLMLVVALLPLPAAAAIAWLRRDAEA